MADIRYVCITPKGKYLRGIYRGKDKNSLTQVLWENELFLLWWEELHPAESESLHVYGKLKPVAIAREEVGELWETMWNHKNPPTVPGKPAGAEALPVREEGYLTANQKKFLQWTAILTGAVFLLYSPLENMTTKLVWRARYRHVVADMERIAQAAQADQAGMGDYAPEVMPGELPARFQKSMPAWPKPPCPGWVYGWDNWGKVPGADNTVRVTLRNPRLYAVYYKCLSSSGDCAPQIMWGHGVPIEQAKDHFVTCRDQLP